MIENGQKKEVDIAELSEKFKTAIESLSKQFADFCKVIISSQNAFLHFRRIYHEDLREDTTDIDRLVNRLIPSESLICALAKVYPNKRVVHLAFHGKKFRTRKKNINRIYKYGGKELNRSG